MFGRAIITLGIGPHSSLHLNYYGALTKPLRMQASIFGACPNQRVAAGRESDIIMADEGCGSLISPDVVVPSRIVSVSASVSPLHDKVQKISSGTSSPG